MVLQHHEGNTFFRRPGFWPYISEAGNGDAKIDDVLQT